MIYANKTVIRLTNASLIVARFRKRIRFKFFKAAAQDFDCSLIISETTADVVQNEFMKTLQKFE